MIYYLLLSDFSIRLDPYMPSSILKAKLLRAFSHLPPWLGGTSFILFLEVCFFFFLNHWFLFLQKPLQD